jgi:hypothetical protein
VLGRCAASLIGAWASAIRWDVGVFTVVSARLAAAGAAVTAPATSRGIFC